jgi:hypothetical protein
MMMKVKVVFLVTILAIGLLFLSACSDKTKDNPTRPVISDIGSAAGTNFNSFSIFFSTMNDRTKVPREQGNKPYRIYLPPGYNFTGTGPKYPILYLFPPFGADELYYFEHGLATVADRLISEGKIGPMIIVSIDGRSLLGGSFYTDSPRQGGYFAALYKDTSYVEPTVIAGQFMLEDRTYTAKAFMTMIDEFYHTLGEPKFRAASGVGVGGYGAFKSVLQTGNFGSVSAIDAPLDFDGEGDGGFLTLFSELYHGSNWNLVDTSTANPAMSTVVSAAAAFASHHVAFQVDSMYYDNFGTLTMGFTVTDTLPVDAATLITKHAAHVPFDSTGAINSAVWSIWMNHNVDSMYENADPLQKAAFPAMKKLLITVENSTAHFDEQMSGFMQFLDANGMEYEHKSFTGSNMLSGTADHYMYDILEDILIFHSDNFRAAGF